MNLLNIWENLTACVDYGYIPASTALEWRDQLTTDERLALAMAMVDRDVRKAVAQ